MKRIRKLTTAFLVIALLVTSLVSVPAFAADAGEADIVRIAGDSRYLTAVAVSEVAYKAPAEADTVVLASGENFPDALAGSVLAAKLKAPILLTKKDSIDAKTLAEIARLKATKVVVLGGEKAIDDSVLNVLTAKGYAVRRIAGENRYETAVLIAKELESSSNEVFLATGENYADALAIGPYAAAQGIPILLTTSDALHKDTAKALKGKTVTILGGEKAVSNAVVREIEEINGVKPTRIAGANREKTALAIAKKYFSNPTPSELIAVTGDNFADAVVGAYFGATFAGGESGALPIVLVRDTLSDEVDKYIRGFAIDDEGELVDDPPAAPTASVTKVYIIGGPKAVSEAAEAELEAALLDLPPTVDPESAEFIKGQAETAGITFTYKHSWTSVEVVVKFDGALLDNELDDAIVTVSPGASTTLKFTKTYLDTLAVGEHTVAVTIDGHAMPGRKIKVTDPKEAVLNAEVDHDEFNEGADTPVVITLSGHYWDAEAGENGELKYTIDLNGAVVKLNNSILNSSLYKLDTATTSPVTVTLNEQCVKELKAGVQKVKIELADRRAVEVEFEVKAPDVAAGASVKFTAVTTEPYDVATMSAVVFTDLSITIVGTIDGYTPEKVALSFNGVKLTAGREYKIEEKVITLRKAFLERQDIGDYSIVVSYDGKALNTLTLTIEEGAVDSNKSEIKIAEEVVAQGIYDVAITLVDAAGNPVLHDKVVKVELAGSGVAKLSKNSDMSEGASSVFVRLNQGKATVYFQASSIGTGFEIKITVNTVTVTTGSFEVKLTAD